MVIYERYTNKESISQWASRVLTPQELVLFNNALNLNNQLWESYQESGLIKKEIIRPVVYSITYERNININIGERITELGQDKLTVHSEFGPWLERYSADVGNPVVIKSAI